MTNIVLTQDEKRDIANKISKLQTAYPKMIKTETPDFVTDEDVAHIETALDVKLPDDYIWFLKTFGEISVLPCTFGFPFHIDGVTLKENKKYFSIIENTLSFRNGVEDEDLIKELQYDLKNIISINTSEEDFQELLAVNTGCALNIEYYWEIDSYWFFGEYLKFGFDDMYRDLLDDNGQATEKYIHFEATSESHTTHTHLIFCSSDTSFDYTYLENGEVKYYETESSLVNLLKRVVTNDSVFGLQAQKSLYKQVIPLDGITTFAVGISDIEETFGMKLSKYEADCFYEHGNIANRLDNDYQLGIKVNNEFIAYQRFYGCAEILYKTLFMQTHEFLSTDLIIIGELQNSKAYLACSVKTKTLYMLTDKANIEISPSLQNFISRLQSNITVPDEITDSRILATKVNEQSRLASQYGTSLVKNGFFGNYPDCMYSIERLNNVWLVFFSERGHVSGVTAYSHSNRVIDKLINQ